MRYPLVTLADVVVSRPGTRDPAAFRSPTFRYVDLESVDRVSKRIATPKVTPSLEAPSRARKVIRTNDVLVALVRPNLNTVALVPPDLDNEIASTGFCVLRATERALPLYLYFAVRSPAFIARLCGLVSGALYPAVTERQVLSQRIPLPDVSEQRRLVDLLSRAENIVRMRKEAEAKAKETVPALFHDMFGDPARNERGWDVAPIGRIGLVQLGRQRAPKYQTGAYTRPYVRVANVFEDRIDVSDLLSMDFDEKDFQQYRLQWGDILLNEGQSIELVGRPAMWRDEVPDCCFQNTLVRFRPDPDLMTSQYVLVALLTFYRNGALSKISSKTSNVAHLGASRFAKLPIACPPMPIQKTFSRHFEHLRNLELSQARAREVAEQGFRSLLAESFKE